MTNGKILPNYYIFKLGCQMNLNDAERLETYLDGLGFKKVSEAKSEMIFVLACSVRQTAVDRVWGGIKRWSKAGKKVYLSGCVLPTDRKKFEDRNIAFFDIKDLNKIVLTNARTINNYSSRRDSAEKFDYFSVNPERSSKIAYITIMTGCDNFCSYCAVPYTRGREVSRPVNDIITEVKDAIDNGFKEIMLLGQNVNSYGQKYCSSAEHASENYNPLDFSSLHSSKNKSSFVDFLKKIDNLPGDFKFTFMSSNPHDMSDKLIEAFANLKKWPRELHLAMQSGDDEILKKMNRKYTSSQYLKLVENCKLKIDNLKLTTDIIVGFPGETKVQFNNTLKLCQKVNFTKAFIAQYSPRPGTASSKLVDDVPQAEKKRRWLVLENLINKN